MKTVINVIITIDIKVIIRLPVIKALLSHKLHTGCLASASKLKIGYQTFDFQFLR
jgi:hypothetical protein